MKNNHGFTIVKILVMLSVGAILVASSYKLVTRLLDKNTVKTNKTSPQTIENESNNCTSEETGNCILQNANHRGISGKCKDGFYGECNFTCHNGAWRLEFDRCVHEDSLPNDLKKEICSSLNHFETCKAYLQYNQLRLRSGKILQVGYVYKKHLKIAKIAVTGPDRPDATITINVYYKKLKNSLDAQGLCTSTDTSKCEKQSYDLKFDFLYPDEEVCYPLDCSTSSAKSDNKPSPQIIENEGNNCTSEKIGNCTLQNANHRGISGKCKDGFYGECNFTCHNGAWRLEFDRCANRCSYPINPEKHCVLDRTAIVGETVNFNCEKGYSGTCSYRCNYDENTHFFDFIEVSNTCGDCSVEISSNGCHLPAKEHEGEWTGTCNGDQTCTYQCDKGNWTQTECKS